jgi:hypothetical protein
MLNLCLLCRLVSILHFDGPYILCLANFLETSSFGMHPARKNLELGYFPLNWGQFCTQLDHIIICLLMLCIAGIVLIRFWFSLLY